MVRVLLEEKKNAHLQFLSLVLYEDSNCVYFIPKIYMMSCLTFVKYFENGEKWLS
jgi:hypothetical protein